MNYYYYYLYYYYIACSSVILLTVFCNNSSANNFFIKKKISEGSDIHDVIIAIKQNNLDILEASLIDRSDPKSQNYGRWMNIDDIGEYIASQKSTQTVKFWLFANGIRQSDIWESKNHEYLKVTTTIEKLNALLETQFFQYEKMIEELSHGEQLIDTSVHRTEGYVIPELLKPHIDCILNTVQFPPPVKHFQKVSASMPPLTGPNGDGNSVPNIPNTESFSNLMKRSLLQQQSPEINSLLIGRKNILEEEDKITNLPEEKYASESSKTGPGLVTAEDIRIKAFVAVEDIPGRRRNTPSAPPSNSEVPKRGRTHGDKFDDDDGASSSSTSTASTDDYTPKVSLIKAPFVYVILSIALNV